MSTKIQQFEGIFYKKFIKILQINNTKKNNENNKTASKKSDIIQFVAKIFEESSLNFDIAKLIVNEAKTYGKYGEK